MWWFIAAVAALGLLAYLARRRSPKHLDSANLDQRTRAHVDYSLIQQTHHNQGGGFGGNGL